MEIIILSHITIIILLYMIIPRGFRKRNTAFSENNYYQTLFLGVVFNLLIACLFVWTFFKWADKVQFWGRPEDASMGTVLLALGTITFLAYLTLLPSLIFQRFLATRLLAASLKEPTP